MRTAAGLAMGVWIVCGILIHRVDSLAVDLLAAAIGIAAVGTELVLSVALFLRSRDQERR
jgi:hypothetical protein